MDIYEVADHDSEDLTFDIDARIVLTREGEIEDARPGNPPAGSGATFFTLTSGGRAGAASRSRSSLESLSRSRSRSRARSRSRSRSNIDGAAGGGEVLASWDVVRRLYAKVGAKGVFPFEELPLALPPGAAGTREEIEKLHAKQAVLAASSRRQKEVEAQADTSDLADIYRPLGIENGGFESTVGLIELVLQISERVGYFYKAVFDRPRPNAVDPTLRPHLAVPPHAAYPSNHSFQMFCVAEMISRLIPEHPGAVELFHVAQRVAENREYAGLHYESDSDAGRELARRFAPYLVDICRREMRRALTEWR